MLDEIVCLGSNSPTDRTTQHRVTGVVLHIEKSGENPAYSLTFKRENTSVVQIGRRPAQETDNAQNASLTSAMFRCAVVSRRHAKIVLSDGGLAYIVDSGSHHGTHLRKLGDSFPRMLKPETSTLLNDGDLVTFGKSVGKGDEWVKPVVAVVQLLYGPPPFKALTVPSPSSSDKSKSSSGRYGINDSASSEDSYSSSDIEDITSDNSPPELTFGPQDQQPTTPVMSDPKPLDQAQDSVTAAYSAIKRFIPPAIRQLPSVSEIIGDAGSGLFDSPGKSFLTLPSFAGTIRKQDDVDMSTFDARRRDILELRLDSRSSSPMDLASPSPASPLSRQFSTPLLTPVIESLSPPFVPLFDMPLVPPVGISSAPPVPGPTLSPVLPSQDSSFDSDVKHLTSPIAISPPPPNGTETIYTATAEIQRTVKQIESSVDKLHGSRRKYKSRFNANVAFMSNKLSEINDKFAEVDAEYNILCDQVEELHNADLPDLARQIEDLNDRVDAIIEDRNDEESRTPAQVSEPMPMEDVRISVKSINDLADEMRAFHLKSQEDFSDRLNNMKAAQDEAMKTIEEAKAIIAQASGIAQEMQAPVPTSLKRKRDDMDEDEDAAVDQTESAPVVVVGAATEESNAAVIELAAEVNQGGENDMETDFLSVNVIEPPPRKKIRTLGSVVAQTATAVTIGAVITWSALAFS